jgi:tetratricopeptide (TPR) repeat protein
VHRRDVHRREWIGVTDVAGYLRTVAEAEASSGSARWTAAAALWERVVERNPVKGSHWARLGEARFELHDFRGALPAYERAAELGVWGGRITDLLFPGEVAYRIACCHARLGEDDRAIEALRSALRLGFRDLDRPRTDGHWRSLLAADAVREMLGIIDADGLSRDEGWRADISFLAREVKRRAPAPFRGGCEPSRSGAEASRSGAEASGSGAEASRGISEADFDARVSRLARAVPDRSDAQIIAGMLKLLQPLGDGHAFIAPPEGDQELNRILPVKFYRFGEGLFVTAAAPAYRRLLGAQVLQVGEHPAGAVLAALEPLISRDNAQQVAWLGPELLPWAPMLHAMGLIADPGRVTLTVRFPDQSTGQATIEATAAPVPRPYPTTAPTAAPDRPCPPGWISLPDTLPGRLPLYLRHCDVLYWFEHLPAHRLVYFQLNGIGDGPAETLAAFCGRLFGFIDRQQAEALVIDLRWNGGGNTLLAQPLLHHLIGCARISQPGGLFVIIGRGTFSAAQNTATAIERETNAIFAGEPSGSRPNFTGETATFQLPYSKAIANVSDLYWQTSWPVDDRPWIAPEIYVPPEFEAYRQNRDPVMEAILACLGPRPAA